MRPLVGLAESDWPAVHALMVARDFPGVPATLREAQPYFRRVTLLGIRSNTGLDVVFVVGEAQDGIAFLDVVCSTQARAKWAQRGLLAALQQHVFGQLQLRAIWVQVCSKTALRAALQAGLTPVTALDAPQPILVMTRLMAGFGNDLVRRKDDGYGQFIQSTNTRTTPTSTPRNRA